MSKTTDTTIVEEKKEPECTVVAEILKEENEIGNWNLTQEQINQYTDFQKRIKINKHLSECKNTKCNELRVERINKGLY